MFVNDLSEPSQTSNFTTFLYLKENPVGSTTYKCPSWSPGALLTIMSFLKYSGFCNQTNSVHSTICNKRVNLQITTVSRPLASDQ